MKYQFDYYADNIYYNYYRLFNSIKEAIKVIEEDMLFCNNNHMLNDVEHYKLYSIDSENEKNRNLIYIIRRK